MSQDFELPGVTPAGLSAPLGSLVGPPLPGGLPGPLPASETAPAPAQVTPSDCGCGGSGACQAVAPQSALAQTALPPVAAAPAASFRPQLVYALGEVGYDFGTEARRDSFVQSMPDGSNPDNPAQLLDYLRKNPYAAASILWTLELDGSPIYVIQPGGPFAAQTYGRMLEFLAGQTWDGVERISIPGVLVGSTMLLNGQIVPVVQPDLRGMYSWSTRRLVEAVCGLNPNGHADSASRTTDSDAEVEDTEAIADTDAVAVPIAENSAADLAKKEDQLSNFLERVYYDLRNLGLSSEERAINFAATNAFQAEEVFTHAAGENLEVDTFTTERSPICRPGADCWDVKLIFFNPKKAREEARRVFRFTVDVSDVVPVTVGRPRTWSVY